MMGMAGTGMGMTTAWLYCVSVMQDTQVEEFLVASGVDAGSDETVDLDREGGDGLDGGLGFGGGAGGDPVEQLLAWLDVVVSPRERGAPVDDFEGLADVVDGLPLAHDPDDCGSASNP
eukprot:8585949-Heterocapsa_arctica.AAC.1